MKHYLGIDPGKQGAFCILNEDSEIIQKIGMPLIGNEYNKNEIRNILCSYDFARIGLENPSIMYKVSKSSAASLMKSVGFLEGLLIGAELPHVLIAPKEWQRECWTHVKIQKKKGKTSNDPKQTSTLAAINLWPKEDFRITNNGNKSINFNDGMIDAALVAEYVRRKF